MNLFTEIDRPGPRWDQHEVSDISLVYALETLHRIMEESRVILSLEEGGYRSLTIAADEGRLFVKRWEDTSDYMLRRDMSNSTVATIAMSIGSQISRIPVQYVVDLAAAEFAVRSFWAKSLPAKSGLSWEPG